MKPIRLLLADDHRMFRQGLRELLERQRTIEVVGEAASGPEVLAAVASLQPDIVLLDIQMPGLNGVEVAKRLAASHPQVKLIMLTMYREDQHLIESIRAGARGYLLKDADAEELVAVIERVARGESALDPALVAGVFAAVRGEASSPGAALTERELEIVRLLAAGHDNRTIASRLYLSEKTVANRLSEIFQKLGVTNRTQAALVAIQRGLASPER
jgi:NarL family two-component system response regulator LiaR